MEKGKLRIHAIDGYICTLFLVEYESGILLFDCGCSSDVPRIEDFITKKLGRSMNHVRLAVATHGHPDHSGGAGRLKQKYAIPSAAPHGLYERYRGSWGLFNKTMDCLLIWNVARRMKKHLENVWFNDKTEVDYYLSAAGTLPVFNDWEVIQAPGHSNHDFILYHPETGVLYASDLMMLYNGRVMLTFAVLFPEAMAISLKRISTLDVNTILMAHGGALVVND